MDGHQRRGAGRIDRNSRAFQVQVVRDPCGRNGEAVARHRGRGDALLQEMQRVFVGRYAEIDAAFRIAQGMAGIAGIFERLVALLEEQAMLRINIVGFLRRDAKEQRVKAIDVVQRA